MRWCVCETSCTLLELGFQEGTPRNTQFFGFNETFCPYMIHAQSESL